jgi:hypothetical protein
MYHDQVTDSILTPQQAADLFPLDWSSWSGASAANFGGIPTWDTMSSFTGGMNGASFGQLPNGMGNMAPYGLNPDSAHTTPDVSFFDIFTGDGLPMWPSEPGELG